MPQVTHSVRWSLGLYTQLVPQSVLLTTPVCVQLQCEMPLFFLNLHTHAHTHAHTHTESKVTVAANLSLSWSSEPSPQSRPSSLCFSLWFSSRTLGPVGPQWREERGREEPVAELVIQGGGSASAFVQLPFSTLQAVLVCHPPRPRPSQCPVCSAQSTSVGSFKRHHTFSRAFPFICW